MDALFNPWFLGGFAALLVAFYAWGFWTEQKKAKRDKEAQSAKEKSTTGGKR